MFGACKYDACEELEFQRDVSDDVCGYMQNFENLVAETFEIPVPNWRSGNFCSKYGFLQCHGQKPDNCL